MERDLLLFIGHTDTHILQELKKRHPEWITQEGYCPQCLDHLRAAMRGEVVVANIAGREVRRREMLAALSLFAAAVLFFGLVRLDAPRAYRISLFFPFYAAILCSLQVRKNHCVVLGLKGARRMGHEEEPVASPSEKAALLREARKILLLSFLFAVLATALCYRFF
jgi:hypothetical protein